MTETETKNIVSENGGSLDGNPVLPKPKRRARKKTAKVEAPQKIKIFSKPVLVSALLLTVLGLAGAAGFFYFQSRSLEAQKNKTELEIYLEKIGAVVVLPEGEEPTLATVSDKEKLKEQSFFASAENGDKVLIFSQAQKIILFRPSIDKIVEVASLGSSLEKDNSEVAQKEEVAPETQVLGEEVKNAPVEPATVVIWNGTNLRGLAGKVKETLADTENVSVVKTGNAKGMYEKTLVVDLSGKNGEVATKLAETVQGEVGILPESELKPEADILIIVGKNQ